MATPSEGTLVITVNLELYDETERDTIAQNLKTLLEERLERWPDSIYEQRIENEYFSRK